MYYIYHIPGIKIGCSKEPDKRVKTQGYTNYLILEEHIDIYKASEREVSLQKEYGYEVDNRNPYYLSVKKIKAAHKRREIFAIKLEDNTIKKYNSIREAANELNIKAPNISEVLRGKQKTAKGYTFKAGSIKKLREAGGKSVAS